MSQFKQPASGMNKQQLIDLSVENTKTKDDIIKDFQTTQGKINKLISEFTKAESLKSKSNPDTQNIG